MKNSITIIKLGGSAITDKNIPYKAREDVITRLSKEIKKTKKTDLIIVNGAGSFAHTSAEKFGGKKGYSSTLGIAIVSNDVEKLSKILLEIFIDQKIPAVRVRPMDIILTKEGKISSHHFKILKEVLSQNLIPILNGDVIWDTKWKSTIYSGEKIISEITKYLIKNRYNIEKIIQVGETNGVYDANNKTIKIINEKNINEIKNFFQTTNRTDVTGGIKHKIDESLLLAKKGINTLIVNGLLENEVYNAIMNKPINGTIITKL